MKQDKQTWEEKKEHWANFIDAYNVLCEKVFQKYPDAHVTCFKKYVEYPKQFTFCSEKYVCQKDLFEVYIFEDGSTFVNLKTWDLIDQEKIYRDDLYLASSNHYIGGQNDYWKLFRDTNTLLSDFCYSHILDEITQAFFTVITSHTFSNGNKVFAVKDTPSNPKSNIDCISNSSTKAFLAKLDQYKLFQ